MPSYSETLGQKFRIALLIVLRAVDIFMEYVQSQKRNYLSLFFIYSSGVLVFRIILIVNTYYNVENNVLSY